MIRLERTEDCVALTSPYSRPLIARAKELGGQWDARSKTWLFPRSREDAVRVMCQTIYGCQPLAPGERGVTVRVTALQSVGCERGPTEHAGIVLADARGRDTGARPGVGVALISGRIGSGGSKKHWQSYVAAGAVFEISGVPPGYADTGDEHFSVEIVPDAHGHTEGYE